MKTNKCGIDLIKQFEGCRLHAYYDVDNLPTIGYGHTSEVDIDMSITQIQADEYLADDLHEFESYVSNYVKIPLTQHQFDALVSFTYNLGPGTLYHSRLLTALNSGNLELAADGFLDYDHAGGVVVPGLTRRRMAERDIFLTPDEQAMVSRPDLWTQIKDWFTRIPK